MNPKHTWSVADQLVSKMKILGKKRTKNEDSQIKNIVTLEEAVEMPSVLTCIPV